MSTWFVDLNNGVDTNSGNSFAQRVKTLSKAATLAVAGDTVKVMGTLPTTTINASWTKGSSLVTLASALTQTLYTDGRWTRASGQVTVSNPTSSPSPKQGSDSAKNFCESTFTVGKIAHWDMGSSINLSAYRQVSFWIQTDVAVNANEIALRLCSDNAGNTVVNSLPINVALNAGRWTCVTLDYGSALGTSIRSLSLSAVNSGYMTNKTVTIDGIIACKAPTASDCLTLNTLISPNGTDWYHVQSINGTSIYIDGQSTTGAQLAAGFQGDNTGAITLNLLQPTVKDIGALSAYRETFSANGSSGSPIIISGGWDPTNMTSQTGWTAFDRSDWASNGINLTGTTGYVRLDRFVLTRCGAPLGLVSNSRGYDFRSCTFAGTGSFSAMPSRAMNLDLVNFINCSGSVAILNIPETANFNSDGSAWTITNTKCFGATVGGIKVPEFISSPSPKISDCNCSGNTGFGFDIQSVVDGFSGNVAKTNTLGGFRFKNIAGFAAYNLTSHANLVSQIELERAFIEVFGLNTNTPGGSTLPQIKHIDDTAGSATIYNWTQYTGAGKVLVDLGNPAAGLASVSPRCSLRRKAAPPAQIAYTLPRVPSQAQA